MDVASLCPLPVGVVWWESPERSLTVIVKGTFALDREGDARLVARQEPLSLDRESAKGDTDELDYASDFAPRKARADVLLVGHAHSVVPLERIRARLTVDDLEIRFVAVAPAPATKIPLVSGHLEAAEPSEGALSVGPRAPWAPERAVLGGAAWRDADRAPLSRRFDFSFFNAARRAQQIDEIAAGASLTLEKLLPGVARRRVRLPGLRPRVFVNQPGAGLMGMGMRLGAPPGPQEITMRCDTLWIDTDRAICTLTWRGVHALPTADTDPAQLVVALASPESEATWAQIQERMHTAMTSTPIQAADLRAVGSAPRGAPDRTAPARSTSTGSSPAGPASVGAASSRFPLGRSKSAPSAPAVVPPPPAPAFVRPVPVPPAYMGPVFAPPAPVGAAAVPPASARTEAVPPASVRSAVPPASVRSEAAPPASVRPAPHASTTLSDEPTISRRSPQQPDPGTISLSDEDLSIDDGELTVALTAQELVELDASEVTFAEADASFWHSSPLDPPTVEMALGALTGVAGREGAPTRDDRWLNEQTVSIGEGDPKESALPFRAASLSALLTSLESIPATEEGTMTFAGTPYLDSLPFEPPIPSRTGTASFESPAIPPRTSVLPFTGEVGPPSTGTLTFESPAIPSRTSALPFTGEVTPSRTRTAPFAREGIPSRTSALPFVESTLPFQAPSPPASGDQAPSPPTGGGVGIRLVATSTTGEPLPFPASSPPTSPALPFQPAASPAAGSALPFQAAPSSMPGGGLPFSQAPIPASRTAPPLDPEEIPRSSAALPFQAAPGPPAGAPRPFQLAGSGLLAGSPRGEMDRAQPFQAPVSPPADLATIRAQPAPEGMRWSPRPADLEAAPVVPVAPRRQAPVDALLPLETYAAVHAAIREGKDLSEVLERHGIEESVWHTNERRQAEAMALEAKQGRTKMALDLFNAMASAQSRAASTDEIELTLDEYAAVRIDVELAEDPAPVLARRGLTAAVWQRLQQRWRQRALVDAKVAQALRKKLAAARSAVSAKASASGGAAAALNPR